MSKLLKKTDGKLTRDQQARRYALVMLLPALIFLACLIAYPLGKVLHDAFSHGVQYPIIAPQTQCLCGFAGFSIQEIMMSKDIFPDSLSYMICSTTLLIRFPFSS